MARALVVPKGNFVSGAVDTVLRPIFSDDGFALQRLAIPDQAFAAVLVPVGEHPALDVDAVDHMVMRCCPVGVAVNEGRVTVVTDEIVGGGRLQVGVDEVEVTLAAPAALPVLPAIIVTQTLVELLAELVYVRWIPRFGAHRARAGSGGS